MFTQAKNSGKGTPRPVCRPASRPDSPALPAGLSAQSAFGAVLQDGPPLQAVRRSQQPSRTCPVEDRSSEWLGREKDRALIPGLLCHGPVSRTESPPGQAVRSLKTPRLPGTASLTIKRGSQVSALNSPTAPKTGAACVLPASQAPSAGQPASALLATVPSSHVTQPHNKTSAERKRGDQEQGRYFCGK